MVTGDTGVPMARRGKLNLFNKVFNRFFNRLFRLRKGRLAFRGAPCCIVHTTGARSGQPRQSPLLYLAVGDGRLAVVGSNGGDDKTPDWVHNLRKQPAVEVEYGGSRVPMTASTADAGTRTELWPKLVEMYPAYATYQTKTTREIPVILLTPAG